MDLDDGVVKNPNRLAGAIGIKSLHAISIKKRIIQ